MNNSLKDFYDRIYRSCQNPSQYAAGLRCSTDLAPLMGFENNLIMPPSYKDKRNNEDASIHHIETRYEPTSKKSVDIAVLESIQGYANLLEKAIVDRYKNEQFPQPWLVLKYKKFNTLQEISVYELPHRIYDAWIRDSNGFSEQEKNELKNDYCAAIKKIIQVAPWCILFGCWNSFEGSNIKIARSITGEIIAGLSSETKRSASRIDPVAPTGGGKDEDGKKAAKTGYGNIPPTIDSNKGGVSVSWIKDNFYLSFNQLRINYPDLDKDACATRALLACAGIYSHLLHVHDGFCLRSLCDLVSLEKQTIYNFIFNGANNDGFSMALDANNAKELYLFALKQQRTIDSDSVKSLEVTSDQQKKIDFIKEKKTSKKKETK